MESGEVRAVASQALAEALILGIDECQEANYPLNQAQKVQLAKMSIMSYDNILEAIASPDIHDLLRLQHSVSGTEAPNNSETEIYSVKVPPVSHPGQTL